MDDDGDFDFDPFPDEALELIEQAESAIAQQKQSMPRNQVHTITPRVDTQARLDVFYQMTQQEAPLASQAPVFDMSKWLMDVPKPAYAPLEDLNVYVYPNQYDVRKYQYNIAQQALFVNTLVCIPTGLGKTLIAAVVMYNYYRWFPEGKLVFLAPTKPLVAQQCQAIKQFVPFADEDCTIMSGTERPDQRALEWLRKRVFFATPQTFRNDLETEIVNKRDIVCVVFDEAHRASGNYAYSTVVELLKDVPYRMLALTATPGSDKDKVVEVCKNLDVYHIELRTEASPDTKQYVHFTEPEIVKVPQHPVIKQLVASLQAIMQPRLNRLLHAGILDERLCGNLSAITQFILMKRMETYRQNFRNKPYTKGIEAEVAIVSQFGRACSVLETYGVQSFHNALKPIIASAQDEKSAKHYHKELVGNAQFMHLWRRVEEWVTTDTLTSGPKADKALAILLEHFAELKADEAESTRAILFVDFRDNADELATMLKRHAPLIRPSLFIGQQSKNQKGMKQKEQLQVINDFKAGKYNVLVATCIGEEGLDVGGVDLIICFDSKSSPTRMVLICSHG